MKESTSQMKTETNNLFRTIKGIFILHRFNYSLISIVCAIAGVFTAFLGNISDVDIWLTVQICLLFFWVHSAAHPINDYYDSDTDELGRPDAPIPGKMVTLKQVRIVIAVNFITSILLIIFIPVNIPCKIFAAGELLCGWIYSAPPIHTTRRDIWAPFTVGIGTLVFPFLGGWSVINGWTFDIILLPGILIGIFMAMIAKVGADIVKIEGDAKYGHTTVAVQMGKYRTFWFIYVLSILTSIIYLASYFFFDYNIYYILAGIFTIAILFTALHRFKRDFGEKSKRKYTDLLALPLFTFMIGIIIGCI